MPCLPISYENLSSASKTYDPTKPIFMLNIWRYRTEAVYAPEHAHLSPSPCTGEEALKRYRQAIYAVLPPNAALHFTSVPVTTVVAPDGEKWDYVALVRYDNLAGFKNMVSCKEYKEEVEPHRLAGLEDFRLIMLDEIEHE